MQGDPLSPLLFILAIDPLQWVLELATQHNLLQSIRGRRPTMRSSLYSDDAAIFVAPKKEDIQNLASIQKDATPLTPCRRGMSNKTVVGTSAPH
jgi:hypothetical protein